MIKNLVLKADDQNPVPVEVLAESIQAISDGMKKIRAGRLNDKALTVLLKDCTNVPMYQIQRVLDGMASLEATYLRPKKQKRQS